MILSKKLNFLLATFALEQGGKRGRCRGNTGRVKGRGSLFFHVAVFKDVSLSRVTFKKQQSGSGYGNGQQTSFLILLAKNVDSTCLTHPWAIFFLYAFSLHLEPKCYKGKKILSAIFHVWTLFQS